MRIIKSVGLVLEQLSSSDWILLVQTFVFAGSATFVAYQLILVRRDLRLRARFEYFSNILDLNRLLVEKPEVAAKLADSAAFGQTKEDHLFFYIMNLFELMCDVRAEGLTADEEWRADRAWFKDALKSEAFAEFWRKVSRTGAYTDDVKKIMDEALQDALREKNVTKAVSS